MNPTVRAALVAVSALASLLLIAPAPRADEPAKPVPGATAEWAAAAQRVAAETEYEIHFRDPASRDDAEGQYQAPNRAHGFRSHFDPERVRIVPRTEQGPRWELILSLVGYGRGTDVRPIDAPTLQSRGRRIDFLRGPLQEWYVNDERGLEQGFTLSRPPEDLPRGAATARVPGRRGRSADDREPAFVVLRLGGDLVPTVSPDGQAIDFAPRTGGLSVLRYAALKVVDARGNELPAHMEGFGEDGARGIRLVFDDSDAVYPVIVDPLTTNAAWTGEGNRELAGFGWSVAGAGDVNGDGFDDVVVGAPFFDAEGPAAGRVFVYHGSPSGLPTVADSTLKGVQGHMFGMSVAAAGDVNGDGFDDVILGSPLVDAAFIQPGAPEGISVTLGTQLSGPAASGFGHSVAGLGDVNRDGFADIAVGAPFDDSNGADSGKVFVYYGGVIVPPGLSWDKPGPAEGAQFGWSVAGGDVGGTIDSDLIVSAPGPPTGRAYVYLGSGSGLPPPPSNDSWNATFAPKPDLFLCSLTRTTPCQADADCPTGQTCLLSRVNPYQEAAPSQKRDVFTVNGGTFVAAVGDINGDGKGDWAVGSPYDGIDSGRVDLYYGTNSLPLPTTASWSTVGTPGSLLGWAVAGAGDTNADGVDDLLIGARGVTDPATEEGRASLYLGSTSGPTDEAGWAVEGDQFYAAFGYSLDSAGDVNGDGIDDVIVGAINAKRGQYLEGLATVYLGSAGLTPIAVGNSLGFQVLYTRAELQDFAQGVLSPLLASEAVGFGPAPGSLLLSTGRASDMGLGDTDWGGAGADTSVFELLAAAPPGKKTFCFTSQFVTAEPDPATDKAFFCFDRNGGTCSSPTHELSALASEGKNPPVGHCIDVDGKTGLFLRFEVRDGGGDGSVDSGLILSRLYFSDLPLPADVMSETTASGYFRNPAPQDVSRLAGTYAYTQSLLSVRGAAMPFDLTVFYDSGSTRVGVLGPRWSHSYESLADLLPDGDDAGSLPDTIQVRIGTSVEYFAETAQGGYQPKFSGSFSSLTYDPASGGVVTYVTKDRRVHRFDAATADGSLRLTSVIDPNGAGIQLSYDGSDRLETLTDTRGKSFSFRYTAGGLLGAVISDAGTPNEARVTFEHDAGTGSLRAITDLDGKTTVFTTTDDARILTGTNADGVTFVSNSYETFRSIDVDQQGDRVVSRRDGRDPDLADPDAGASFAYDGDTVTSADRLDPPRLTRRQYDAKGRVAAQVDPTGVRTEFDYDRDDHRIETRRQLPSEPDPRVVQRAIYDERGNLTRQVDFPGVCIANPSTPCSVDQDCPAGTCGVVGAMSFDLDNNLRSSIDHHGNRFTYDYDIAGNLIRTSDPLGNETRLTYAKLAGRNVVSPRPVSKTNARGFTSTSEFDAYGQLLRATDPLGGRVTHAYDGRGRRTSTTDPLGEADPSGGHTTCFDYDGVGRPVQVRALCGTPGEFVKRTRVYDADGRVVSQTEADGAVSRVVYTDSGQVAERIDPLGQPVRYTYDPEDRPETIEAASPYARADGGTGGLRVVSSYAYDDGDRLIGTTQSVGACVGGDPAAAGQGCTTDAECAGGGRCGVSIVADYDEIGNLIRLEDPNGNVSRFEYDLLGRVIAQGPDLDDDGAIDPNGVERATYDGRGLQTSLTTARGHTIAYVYDAAARETGFTFGAHVVSHVLDPQRNRVLSTLDGAIVTREFDALDRLNSRTDEFGNRTGAVYDAAGRLVQLVYPSDLDGDGERDRAVYGYDALDRLTSVLTDWDGHLTTYDYDLVGRLTQATLPDGSVVTYSYDAAGRLTGISDPAGEFSAAYTLNGAGLRTSADLSLPLDPTLAAENVTYTYGPRNEVLSSSTGAGFAYDESGNMVTGTIGGSPVALVHDELGQLLSVNGDACRYDVDGLRVETDRGGTVRRYVYDTFSSVPRLLEEHDQYGNVVARYVHGRGLISRTGPEGLRVYHYDSRGSTVSLTSQGGAITDRYAYDPFGRPAGHVGSTIQPFRYNGRDGVFDDDNGLYYMRARYYAPELQRFIQMDQGFRGDLTDIQSLNRYAFVGGDPIHRVDPSGEFGILGAFVGGIVGAAVSVTAECWDGCSTGEAFGAVVEGTIAGAFIGANPAIGVYSAVAAGLGGAAAGIVVEAAIDGKLDAGEGGLFTEAGLARAGVRLVIGGAGGAASAVGGRVLGRLVAKPVTANGRGALTFARAGITRWTGGAAPAGRALVRQPIASVTRASTSRLTRLGVEVASELPGEALENYVGEPLQDRIDEEWAP